MNLVASEHFCAKQDGTLAIFVNWMNSGNIHALLKLLVHSTLC